MDAEHRMVPMTQEQYDALNEHVIPALMRAELNEMASHLMTLALAYKWAAEPIGRVRDGALHWVDKDGTPHSGPMPKNVVELHSHSRKVGA